MFKYFFILLLSFTLVISCSIKEKVELEVIPEESAIAIYEEAVIALTNGEAFFAANKFREVESLMPQSKWAAKASLMAC